MIMTGTAFTDDLHVVEEGRVFCSEANGSLMSSRQAPVWYSGPSGDVDTVVEMRTTRCYKFIYKSM